MNNSLDKGPMSLAVIGLGNMGVSVAAVALRRGFHVVAMDVEATKVAMTDRGECVVPEPGIAEVFTDARHDSRLVATTSLEQTIAETDACFIAVPTPPDNAGDVDYVGVRSGCGSSGELNVRLRRGGSPNEAGNHHVQYSC